MKASEWASKFQTTSDVFKTVDEFVAEALKLIETRTKTSKGTDFVRGATEGAVRETKAKWLAIMGRCPRIKMFTFDQIVKKIRAHAPDNSYRYIAA